MNDQQVTEATLQKQRKCIKCLDPIAAARLESVPDARRCTKCQEQIDDEAAYRAERAASPYTDWQVKDEFEKQEDKEAAEQAAADRAAKAAQRAQQAAFNSKARLELIREAHDACLQDAWLRSQGHVTYVRESADPVARQIIDRYQNDTSLGAALFFYLQFCQQLSGRKYGEFRPVRVGNRIAKVNSFDGLDSDDVLMNLVCSVLRQARRFKGMNNAGEPVPISHWVWSIFERQLKRSKGKFWSYVYNEESFAEDDSEDDNGMVQRESRHWWTSDSYGEAASRKSAWFESEGETKEERERRQKYLRVPESKSPLKLIADRNLKERGLDYVCQENPIYAQICMLLVAGKENKSIAATLRISPSMVTKHKKEMKKKVEEFIHLRKADKEIFMWPTWAKQHIGVSRIWSRLCGVKPDLAANIRAGVPLGQISASMGWDIRSLRHYLRDFRLAIAEGLAESPLPVSGSIERIEAAA